jgi:hypothetical protein
MRRLLLVSTLVSLMLAMSAGSVFAYEGNPQDKNARHAEPDLVPHFGGCVDTYKGSHGPSNCF